MQQRTCLDGIFNFVYIFVGAFKVNAISWSLKVTFNLTGLIRLFYDKDYNELFESKIVIFSYPSVQHVFWVLKRTISLRRFF